MSAQEMPAAVLSDRVRRLRDRAWDGQWGANVDRGAMLCAALEKHKAEPRKLQIARALMVVCEQMPIHIAEDEPVIGRRTAVGYPEIDDAIARGSAEPGYMIADYPRALNEGLLSIITRCHERLEDLDETDPEQANRIDTLRSIILACEAAIRLAVRHAEEAQRQAAECACPMRKRELHELARICRKVPAYPAETLHEAVQSLWLVHLAVYLECENVAFSFGQMDQYLNPFYQADLQAGRIDRDGALELIQCLWIKVYENVFGGLGHVQTVTVAGQTPEGEDGVNDMTWIIWEATRELMNVGPSVATRIHRGTDEAALRYLLSLIRDGRYMPQLYNDDMMVPALVSKGVAPEHARQYGLIGCHEPTICGMGYFRSASWPGYVCFQEWLELALGDGARLSCGTVLGPRTGDPADFETFEDLWTAFQAQMAAGVKRSVIAAHRGEAVKRTLTPRPMMSALTKGCIDSGLDFTEGGALYNMSGFQAFGIATCADSLHAIRTLVYEQQELTLPQLVDILRADWVGHEMLQARVRGELAHYGNDIDEVDALAVRMVKELEEQVGRYRNVRGGPFLLGLWSFWSHIGWGKMLAASADGRRQGEALSHSMDPMMGRGLTGPTAAMRSAAKIDTSKLANGGSLLLEFQPALLRSEDGLAALSALCRTYFSMGGIQLQLSSVDATTLEAAQQSPDAYRHLVVRVAGYCDYFTRQSPEHQAYIIAREKFAEA